MIAIAVAAMRQRRLAGIEEDETRLGFVKLGDQPALTAAGPSDDATDTNGTEDIGENMNDELVINLLFTLRPP